MDSWRWVLFKIHFWKKIDNNINFLPNRSFLRWFWMPSSVTYSWRHSTSKIGSSVNHRRRHSLSFPSISLPSKFFQSWNICLWVCFFKKWMISNWNSSLQIKAKKFPNDFIFLVIPENNCVLNWIIDNRSKVSLLISFIVRFLLGPLLVYLSLLVSSWLHNWKNYKFSVSHFSFSIIQTFFCMSCLISGSSGCLLSLLGFLTKSSCLWLQRYWQPSLLTIFGTSSHQLLINSSFSMRSFLFCNTLLNSEIYVNKDVR